MQFSAGIVILSEVLRYAQIIRERPGLWQGRFGIEPTQAVLEIASPALEHSPLYWRIPSLHAPPGAAAFYVSAHRGRS